MLRYLLVDGLVYGRAGRGEYDLLLVKWGRRSSLVRRHGEEVEVRMGEVRRFLFGG
jgi:hypothetical protein